MYETVTAIHFLWIFFAGLSFAIVLGVLIRYYLEYKKDDYVYRDDYTIDDFYRPKE